MTRLIAVTTAALLAATTAASLAVAPAHSQTADYNIQFTSPVIGCGALDNAQEALRIHTLHSWPAAKEFAYRTLQALNL